MVDVLNFYMDDSGTRHPDRRPGWPSEHKYDWFGLGGILLKEEEEDELRTLYKDFCAKWQITYPLHSSEIRGKTKKFFWLRKIDEELQLEFYQDLSNLMGSVPAVGHACVIDRPGYNHRYRERYGTQRWSLCKTAFSISVERAVKFARRIGYRFPQCRWRTSICGQCVWEATQ